MFVSTFKKKLLFFLLFFIIVFLIKIILFYPVYMSNNIIIDFAIHPFIINKEYPNTWSIIKLTYLIFSFINYLIFFNYFYSLIFSKKNKLNNTSNQNITNLNLLIGKDINGNNLYLEEHALYQNILVTGTIGSGKTSSALYPFTEQLINYKNKFNKKLGILILDVKGNYHKYVNILCKKYNREKDLIVLSLNSNIKYNPLDKPNLKASILANRLKTILTLFSPNNGESYWLDKCEQILTECIKLCRLYNNNYVTFLEIHKLVSEPNYYKSKISDLRGKFISGIFSKEDCFNLLTSITFFEKEFFQLDSRTMSILKSEITRITGCFTSDYQVQNTFCPPQKEITFYGFTDLINTGKILVLNMNISEFKNLSKIIATYLKLDFQTEVLNRLSYLSSNSINSVAFICDEYQEYVTSTDADFFSQCREAKCINIISTQSYTSILNSLNNQNATKTIIQNLVNKLWFRTDDIFTIEDIQKQIGKEEKTKISKTISENAKTTNFNIFTKKFNSIDSNLSESINTYSQLDYIYDTNFFTQKLEIFSCVAFISDGSKILPPQQIKMLPYFKN